MLLMFPLLEINWNVFQLIRRQRLMYSTRVCSLVNLRGGWVGGGRWVGGVGGWGVGGG